MVLRDGGGEARVALQQREEKENMREKVKSAEAEAQGDRGARW